jgi:hypothetical protein
MTLALSRASGVSREAVTMLKWDGQKFRVSLSSSARCAPGRRAENRDIRRVLASNDLSGDLSGRFKVKRQVFKLK